jgi:tetratricopeptide (TPR) repeat protein
VQAERASSKAIKLAPSDARAHKAHGFVLSAQNKLQEAIVSYQTAVELNPKAWDVLINMGELTGLLGQPTDAITYYKKALNAMTETSPESDSRGKAWRPQIGTLIGNKYLALGNKNEAEIWYRHVLTFAPFFGDATKGLSDVLSQTGRSGEAERLCQDYVDRIGERVCE